MRLGLIFGIFALTALVFFTAVQTLPVEASRTAAIADPGGAADQEELTKTLEENVGLRTSLADLEKKNATLLTTLETTQAEREQLEGALASLQAAETDNSEMTENVQTMSETLAALQAELEATQMASKAAQDEAQAKGVEMSQAQEKIETLEAGLAELTREREIAVARIADLESDVEVPIEPENSVAFLEAVAQRDAALEDLANLKKETENQTLVSLEMTELVAAMKDRIAALQSNLAEQETKITALNASAQAPTISAAAQCQSRTDALTSAISFEGATTAISAQNMSVLDELSGIVAECIQEDAVLEIEGHTDNEGGVASNLLLSNGRANAVLAFLVERGIQADAMRAVGFGASDPVADNATAEGRSLNQRIVFDWEMK